MDNKSISEKPEPSASEDVNFFILVKIAVYDNIRSIPRVVDFSYNNISDFINDASQKTYALSRELGGKVPFTIIREVVENLIHADFREAVITIMSEGNHIMISDQGPGIDNKEKAILPGYSSATTTMKKYIRGVGSGLPIVSETITFSGGSIDITDNIKRGTVISLKIDPGTRSQEEQSIASTNEQESDSDSLEKKLSTSIFEKLSNQILSERQKKILFLMLELEEAGPSTVAEELNFSLSTAYRELTFLEKNRLFTSGSSGKRKLSKKGLKYLEYYSNNL